MRKNKIIFISFLIFMFTFFILPSNVLSVEQDYNFTFDNDVLYSESNSSSVYFNNSFNMKDYTYSNGTYPGTYSFTNEVIGTSDTDIEFITEFTPNLNTEAIIINSKNEHKKVLKLIDNNNTEPFQIISNFTNAISSGSIEYWILQSDVNDQFYMRTKDNLELTAFRFRTDSGTYDFYDGTWHNLGSITNDEWFHIRVDFECSNNGYLGLAQYTTNVYQNGIDYGVFGFENNVNNLKLLNLHSNTIDTFETYIDAIGYSWNYTSDSAFTTGIDLVDINEPFGTYVSGVLSDTYTIDSSYYVIDSETEEGNNLISFGINFSVAIEGFFNCLIESTETLSTFKLRNSDGDVLYNTDDTDIMSINDLSVNEIGDFIWIQAVDLLDTFTINIDYIKLKTNLSFGYEIGNNLYPTIITNSSIKEVDKFEFAIGSANTLYPVGYDNPDNWNDIENGFDNTNIAVDLTDPLNNRVVQIEGDGTTHEITGLERTFNIESGIINISYTLNFSKTDNNVGGINCSIYSADNTLITMINIYRWNALFGMNVERFDGSTYIVLIDGLIDSNLAINDKIEFEIYIDSWINFTLKENDDWIGNWNFKKIDNTKEGLGKIKFESIVQNDPGQDNICNLHNVEVDINYTSQSDGFGYLEKDLFNYDIFWGFQSHSQFFITATGQFTLLVASTDDYTFGSNTESINLPNYYDGSELYTNLYPYTFIHFPSFTGIYKPKLLFFCISDVKITDIDIFGIRLDYQNLTFPFEFEYANIDYNESYFYVDSGNRLRFTHTSNDTNTEYIQAIFTVESLEMNSTNSAIQYNSYKTTYYSFGYISIEYLNNENIMEIESGYDFKKIQLTQKEKIFYLNVLITDNDLDEIIGNTEGYISYITILNVLDISLPIETYNLVGMMIPLIIILIPTLAISKSFGKALIVPFFLFMSILCVATEIIPIWLFFVIAISNSLFLFKKRVDIIG